MPTFTFENLFLIDDFGGSNPNIQRVTTNNSFETREIDFTGSELQNGDTFLLTLEFVGPPDGPGGPVPGSPFTATFVDSASDGGIYFTANLRLNQKPPFGGDYPGRIETYLLTPDSYSPNGTPAPPPSNQPFMCFAPGTLIATPAGERRVEDLAHGDPVLTADGRIVPVKWIGHLTRSVHVHPVEVVCPVLIRAGALGENVPHTDLVLTADHALEIDGLLVNAGALVNGTSVVRVPKADLGDRVTYYHIETADHDVILANGCPAETFVDNVSRRAFDNFAEYEALFGAAADTGEVDRWRVMSRRQLPARVRARLADRAVAIGAEATVAA